MGDRDRPDQRAAGGDGSYRVVTMDYARDKADIFVHRHRQFHVITHVI